MIFQPNLQLKMIQDQKLKDMQAVNLQGKQRQHQNFKQIQLKVTVSDQIKAIQNNPKIQDPEQQYLRKMNQKIRGILSNKQIYNAQAQTLNLDSCSSWIKVLRLVDCANLTSLSLKYCFITQFNIVILTQQSWRQLRCLDLSYNKLKKGGVQQLMKINFPKVNSIDLGWNNILDIGFKTVVKKIKKLQTLNVEQNQITNIGLKHILKIDLTYLKNLNLGYNKIGHRGISTLVLLKMPNIQKLSLKNCHVGNQGCKNLIKGDWPNLKQLILINTYHRVLNNFQFLTDNVWKSIEKIEVGFNQSGDFVENSPITLLRVALFRSSSIKVNNQVQQNQTILSRVMGIISSKKEPMDEI